MITMEDLDQLDEALEKATPGRWAMFKDEDETFALVPAMRKGIIAEGLTPENAMLIHLLKWNAEQLIGLAKIGLEFLTSKDDEEEKIP